MASPSLPATKPASTALRIPSTLVLAVSCSPSDATERICTANGVELTTRMPRANAPRREFLALRWDEGLELMKAPPQVRSPGDDVAGPLQHLIARIIVAKVEDGAEVCVAFRWRPARTGYLSLWPLTILLFVTGSTYGLPGIAVVLAGFVVVHWPRDVQARRLALIAKLSDALGPVLIDRERNGPYR